jgi:hypothetical protein
LYLTPKERDGAYEQQRDVIFKPKHLQFKALLVILDDITFFHHIRENFENDTRVIIIQGQLRGHQQVHYFSSDHVKFKFQDGLLYRDGLLYVLDGHVQLQVF